MMSLCPNNARYSSKRGHYIAHVSTNNARYSRLGHKTTSIIYFWRSFIKRPRCHSPAAGRLMAVRLYLLFFSYAIGKHQNCAFYKKAIVDSIMHVKT